MTTLSSYIAIAICCYCTLENSLILYLFNTKWSWGQQLMQLRTIIIESLMKCAHNFKESTKLTRSNNKFFYDLFFPQEAPPFNWISLDRLHWPRLLWPGFHLLRLALPTCSSSAPADAAFLFAETTSSNRYQPGSGFGYPKSTNLDQICAQLDVVNRIELRWTGLWCARGSRSRSLTLLEEICTAVESLHWVSN